MSEFLTPEQQDADNYSGPSPVAIPFLPPTLMSLSNATLHKSSDFAFVGSNSWKILKNPSPLISTIFVTTHAQNRRRRPNNESDPNNESQFCAKEGGVYTISRRAMYTGSETFFSFNTTVIVDWDGLTPGFIDLSDQIVTNITVASGWVEHVLTIGPCSPGTASIRISNRFNRNAGFSGIIYMDSMSVEGPNSCPDQFIPLRQRQRDDGVRVRGSGRNNPSSKQMSARQGWANTYL